MDEVASIFIAIVDYGVESQTDIEKVTVNKMHSNSEELSDIDIESDVSID